MRDQRLLLVLFPLAILVPAISFGGDWDERRILFGIFVEAALLAIVAAPPITRRTFLSLLGLGTAAGIALALVCAPGRIGSVLLAQAVIAAFAGFVRALSAALDRPFGARAAALAAALVGLSLLVSPLWIDPLLDAVGSGGGRARLLHLSLVLNPLASVSSGVFGVDWIREGSLYSGTRFASTDPFVYPSWVTTLVIFLVLWGGFTALGRFRGAHRRRRGRRAVEDDRPGSA